MKKTGEEYYMYHLIDVKIIINKKVKIVKDKLHHYYQVD